MRRMMTASTPLRTRVRCAPTAFALLAGTASGQVVLYVNPAAPPGGDGLSWVTAFRNLQDALAAPVFPPAHEIWVAQGTYKPHNQDKNLSFELRDDLTIYGGFAGGEANLNQRDPLAHPTILSGDLKGNDGPDFTFRSDNSYHIVNALNAGPTAILDGFTIRAGNADGNSKPLQRGGGLMVTGGGPTLRNCTFDDNHATRSGGAIHCSDSQPTVESCRFMASVSGPDGGGAVMSDHSTLLVTDCSFEGGLTKEGGGVLVMNGSASIIGCTFSQNHANYAGSGVSINQGVLTLDGCTFSANTGYYGAGFYARNSAVTVSACSFDGNSGFLGGAVHMFGDQGNQGSGAFDECSFTNNQAPDGSAI